MSNATTIKLPSLACRRLPEYSADKLDSVQAAFRHADSCALGQGWLAKPDKDFAPATVRVGWLGHSLRVYAELDDADIFSRATAHNQRMWELGDVLEIFLHPEGSASYVEVHVTPNNFRLQLKFPDTATLRRAQAANHFDDLLLGEGVFHSHTWTDAKHGKWFVHAEIPAGLVAGAEAFPPKTSWRFSFSRYDGTRGRQEPVISSSSPHAKPDFHRRDEFGTLSFDQK
jgi:hypothetical protein